MFHRLLIIGLAALSFSTTACRTDLTAAGLDPALFPAADGIDPAHPYLERTTTQVEFSGVDTLRVELPQGKLTITQADDAQAAVLKTVEKIVLPGLDILRLADLLKGSGVAARRAFVDQSRLDVTTTLHRDLHLQDIVFEVSLTLPAGVNIEIFMNRGPVTITNLTGSVEIRTAQGAVNIDHVVGDVVVETSGQPISVVDVNGDAQLETADADISARLTLPIQTSISATTSDGDIHISVPKTLSVALDLRAEDGFVEADLTGFTLKDISFGASFFSGLLNDGGGAIEARTTNGDISFEGVEE